jgi:Ca2+-binding EF-hand superfamily protein
MQPNAARYKIQQEVFENLMTLTERFGLNRKFLDNFYKEFCEIDVNFTGVITMTEFHEFFDLDKTDFTAKTFKIMDRGNSAHAATRPPSNCCDVTTPDTADGSNQIDFVEFIFSIYNYCTFSWDGLVRYTFDLHDLNGTNELTMGQIHEMVSVLYGAEINDRAEKALKKIDTNNDGSITWAEFRDNARRFPVLLFPAFHVQEEIRKKVFGPVFWLKESTKVYQEQGLAPGDTVLGIITGVASQMHEESGAGTAMVTQAWDNSAAARAARAADAAAAAKAVDSGGGGGGGGDGTSEPPAESVSGDRVEAIVAPVPDTSAAAERRTSGSAKVPGAHGPAAPSLKEVLAAPAKNAHHQRQHPNDLNAPRGQGVVHQRRGSTVQDPGWEGDAPGGSAGADGAAGEPRRKRRTSTAEVGAAAGGGRRGSAHSHAAGGGAKRRQSVTVDEIGTSHYFGTGATEAAVAPTGAAAYAAAHPQPKPKGRRRSSVTGPKKPGRRRSSISKPKTKVHTDADAENEGDGEGEEDSDEE